MPAEDSHPFAHHGRKVDYEGDELSTYQASRTVRRMISLCRVWATMPTSARASSSAYQPQLPRTTSMNAPFVKSAESSDPTSSIRPATTPTAPARELATASTIIGMLPTTATRRRTRLAMRLADDRQADENGYPVPVDPECDDEARTDGKAERRHGEDHCHRVVEIGEDREDEAEDQPRDPAEHGAEETLISHRGEQPGSEGEPGEEPPDREEEPEHELPGEEHGASSEDREKAQDDVCHSCNVGLRAFDACEDTDEAFGEPHCEWEQQRRARAGLSRAEAWLSP